MITLFGKEKVQTLYMLNFNIKSWRLFQIIHGIFTIIDFSEIISKIQSLPADCYTKFFKVQADLAKQILRDIVLL